MYTYSHIYGKYQELLSVGPQTGLEKSFEQGSAQAGIPALALVLAM
jgi:hypothetical protein